MLKNSPVEKWEYREHTRVKHELLRKYLIPWIIKLGSFHRKVLFIDGFAGRGEYIEKKTGKLVSLGSPIIALQVANNLLQQAEEGKKRPYFDKFVCFFIEKDKDNFNNLQDVINREKEKLKFKDKLSVYPFNEEFAHIVDHLLEEVGARIGPSFFFIDPFGFSGVPFATVKNILSLPRTEIFFTFMTRDINRFLAVPHVERILDQLYPTPEWRQVYKLRNWRERDQALKDLYIKSLLEDAEVKYTWAFRVCMDEKYQTLYYLIYATNHFDGLKIMKDIMYHQAESGMFAYLGPEESRYRSQLKLFEEDMSSLQRYLTDRFKGERKTFRQILEETYMDTPFVEKHYRSAFRQLEEKRKIGVQNKGPRGGIYYFTEIIFPKSNPVQMRLLKSVPEPVSKALGKIRIHHKEYQLLDGTKKNLVQKVNDGSIIARFDKTPLPKRKIDIVCPHFLELKWAYGCPFDCAWCYLKGTFRFRPSGKSPVVKSYDKVKLHVEGFLEEAKEPEILNTGEIADSLMNENADFPFSKLIIPLFERQNRHKVLFLTKSAQIGNLLETGPHNQVVVSFSFNAIPVAERWEKAPHVLERIEAGRRIFDVVDEVRVRIDPMVPIEGWRKHYLELLEIIFKNFTPERITLGSLRGLQSTINGCTDKTWVRYLKESSNWGKKIDFRTRYNMYSAIIQELKFTYEFDRVALCKETVQMWDALKMDYKNAKCNCVL